MSSLFMRDSNGSFLSFVHVVYAKSVCNMQRHKRYASWELGVCGKYLPQVPCFRRGIRGFYPPNVYLYFLLLWQKFSYGFPVSSAATVELYELICAE